MHPTPIIRTLLICAALALPGAALAQEETTEDAQTEVQTETPADPLPEAEDQEQVEAPEADLPLEPGVAQAGETVVAATHRDWQILCGRLAGSEEDSCEMYQLLEADEGPIAEISIVTLPAGSQFPAGATITTPLETFLPPGLLFRIDGGEPRQEPFLVCTVIGCIARLGLESGEVNRMQRGVNASVTIASVAAIDEPIEVPVSLLGFTAALEDLRARMPAE